MATGCTSSRQEVKTRRACRSLSAFQLPPGGLRLSGQAKRSALRRRGYLGELAPQLLRSRIYTQHPKPSVLNSTPFQWRAVVLCAFALVVGARAQEVLA